MCNTASIILMGRNAAKKRKVSTHCRKPKIQNCNTRKAFTT
jgi:hypothetical protein